MLAASDRDLYERCFGRRLAQKLSEVSAQELARWSGADAQAKLGRIGAERLEAALELGRRVATPQKAGMEFSGPKDIYDYLKPKMAHLPIEVFMVLCLNARHKLMGEFTVAQGGLASCAISPRDVFDPAIRLSAPALVFAHNHPSGDPTPSQDDERLTDRLVEAAKILGFAVVDHVVVAGSGYASFAERGKL